MLKVHAVIALLATLAALPVAAASSVAGAQPDIAKICRHYENRARFTPREGAVAPVARIADACGSALRMIEADAGPSARRAAAVAFLVRLGHARARIDAINAERTQIAFAARRAESGAPRLLMRNLSRAVGLVTPTGEYLIFRIEGVFDALDAWVETDEGARRMATR